MPSVNLLVLTATGQYQRRKAQTDHQWSKHLINHRLGQAHWLTNHPIFYDEKPVDLKSLDDLRFFMPPPPSKMPRKLVGLVEDNSPYCYAPEPPRAFTERLHDHADAYQEGAQAADIRATNELMRESAFYTLVWLSTIVVSITVLVFVAIIAWTQWGRVEETPGSVAPGKEVRVWPRLSSQQTLLVK